MNCDELNNRDAIKSRLKSEVKAAEANLRKKKEQRSKIGRRAKLVEMRLRATIGDDQ
jgi:hypothetical protein